VKADPEWQGGTGGSGKGARFGLHRRGCETRGAVVRFLGCEAATRELARRFWSGNDQPFGWDLKFGLFGSPFRASAIEAMKAAALKDPQHPVTQEFVQTLATLEMQSDPKYRFPKYDETNKEAWMKVRDAYFAAFNKQVADHMSGVGASLQGKFGKARAVSVSELLQSE
jgi:hypothetical protein